MKLTVDFDLTPQQVADSGTSALAILLSKGRVSRSTQPLEACVSEAFSLPSNVDYPIAAIAANVDGLGDSLGCDDGDYWLRAEPVNLVLQRDCVSLGETIPLAINTTHAVSLIAALNQHFIPDGLCFAIGHSGAWYVKLNAHFFQSNHPQSMGFQSYEIRTSLPRVVIGKNIQHFLPQGKDAAKLVAISNEIQMLLHEHPINVARESAGELAVNSVWFSGGGTIPALLKPNSVPHDLVVADHVVYQGLAQYASVPFLALPQALDVVLKTAAKAVRLQLPAMLPAKLENDWLMPIIIALKSKTITQLRLNLGVDAYCIHVDIRPRDFLRFWRKVKPLTHFLNVSSAVI